MQSIDDELKLYGKQFENIAAKLIYQFIQICTVFTGYNELSVAVERAGNLIDLITHMQFQFKAMDVWPRSNLIYSGIYSCHLSFGKRKKQTAAAFSTRPDLVSTRSPKAI